MVKISHLERSNCKPNKKSKKFAMYLCANVVKTVKCCMECEIKKILSSSCLSTTSSSLLPLLYRTHFSLFPLLYTLFSTPSSPLLFSGPNSLLPPLFSVHSSFLPLLFFLCSAPSYFILFSILPSICSFVSNYSSLFTLLCSLSFQKSLSSVLHILFFHFFFSRGFIFRLLIFRF